MLHGAAERKPMDQEQSIPSPRQEKIVYRGPSIGSDRGRCGGEPCRTTPKNSGNTIVGRRNAMKRRVDQAGEATESSPSQPTRRREQVLGKLKVFRLSIERFRFVGPDPL